MVFDFSRFEKTARRVYKDGNLFSLDECLKVFRYYFWQYELNMGKPHPPIKAEHIASIIEKMPWVVEEDYGSRFSDIDVPGYCSIIAKHFHTKYRNCDYCILHFFSGKIRELRFYEECY